MSSIFQNLLAEHCAAAMYGVKSANLINIKLNILPNIEEDIAEFNELFKSEIKIKILDANETRYLLIVYTPNKLYNVLFNEENYNYLKNLGYHQKKSLTSYLDILSNKISSNNQFPHEIGLFLNYELSDVIAFQNNDKKCLYTGYWKVYSDVERKIEVFNKYTRCKIAMKNEIRKGKMLNYIF